MFVREGKNIYLKNLDKKTARMATKLEKEERTENFIEEWKDLRSLWDVLSPEYRDRNERRKSYENLATVCEIPGKKL